MAQLTVRNLPDELVAALKARAAANGRSMEAEHRRILMEEFAKVEEKGRAVAAFLEKAAAFRARIGPLPPGEPDSTELIRQMRDERWG
jgi:antitoxin FitA